MAEKFELITGTSGPNAGAMPAGLEKHGTALWEQVMAEYNLEDVGGREMLGQICHAADMAARCRAHIDKEGGADPDQDRAAREPDAGGHELA